MVLELQSPRPQDLGALPAVTSCLFTPRQMAVREKVRTGRGKELPAKLIQSGTDFPINSVNSSLSTSRTFRALSLLRFPPLYIVTVAMTFPHGGLRRHLNHGTPRGQR